MTDRQVQSDEARRNLRNLLNEVEHEDAHVTVLRYQTPAAVIVPVDWYRDAVQMLALLERAYADANAAQDSFLAEAIREGRRAAGLPVNDPEGTS